MTGGAAARRGWRAILIATGLGLVAAEVLAQSGPPLQATLTLKDPPAGAVYVPGAPVSLLLEVANEGPGAVVTTADFSRGQFWRRLFFTDQAGGIITNEAAAAGLESETRTSYCFSRQGVLLRPTAIPIVPVEVLPAPSAPGAPDGFVLHYALDDARQFYALRPGRYTVNARIPLLTFRAASGGTFDDCDQFEGQTVANLAALSPGDGVAIVSNDVQFTVASPFRFAFKGAVKGDTACPAASQTPCKIAKIGKPIKVQFQVFGPTAKVVVPNLTARIAFTRVGGGVATLPTDRVTYDAKKRVYLFDLPTRALTPGPWRIDVSIEEDGTVHSAHVLLKGGPR